MKSKESYEAKILALENAGAMILEHGCEGGIDQSDYHVPIELYLREKEAVANMLFRMANKIRREQKL